MTKLCPICCRQSLNRQGGCEACGADFGAVNVELIRCAQRTIEDMLVARAQLAGGAIVPMELGVKEALVNGDV